MTKSWPRSNGHSDTRVRQGGWGGDGEERTEGGRGGARKEHEDGTWEVKAGLLDPCMLNEFSSRLEAPVSNRRDFSESRSAGKSYPLDHDRPRDTHDTLTPSQRRLVSKYSENTTPSDQKGGNHYPLRKPPQADVPRDLIRDLHAKTASLEQQLRTATDQVRVLYTENESLLQSASYEQVLA